MGEYDNTQMAERPEIRGQGSEGNANGEPAKRTIKFYRLAIGAQFSLRGQVFTKSAMRLAQDEKGHGHVFLGLVDTLPVGEPLLLPPDEARKWRPNYGPWNEGLMKEFNTTLTEEEG